MAGTKVADVFIGISADLTQFNSALKGAEKTGATLGTSIRKSFTGAFGGTFKEDMRALVRDLGSGKAGLPNIRAEAGRVGGALKAAFSTASHKVFSASLNGIHKILGTLKSAATNVFKGLFIGAGIAAFQDITRVVSDLVHVIPDLISQGRDYGQMVDNIMDATGATGEQASKLAAAVRFLDPGEVTNLVQLIAQFSKNVLGSAIEPGKLTPVVQEMVKLNLITVDYTGNILKAKGQIANQVEALDILRSGISKLSDGTRKLQLEAMMQGRGGPKVFLDYFRLSDADMAKLEADWKAMGLILTAEQAQLAEDSNREARRLGMSLAGLGMELFTAIGPQLNALVSAITTFITTNLEGIKAFAANAASLVIGFISQIVGATDASKAFTASITGEALQATAAEQNLTLLGGQLDQLDADYAAAQESAVDATGSTKDLTKAYTDQIAAVQALEAAQERAYQKRLKNIQSILDERLATLDATEATLEAARAKQDLAIQLLAAQEDFRKSQTSGEGGTIDFEAEEKAHARILDIQAQQREAARVAGIDAQRTQIEDVKAYLTEVDRIVSESIDKAATLKLLKRLEGALTAGGQPAEGSDAALMLQGVLEAEKRLTQQVANEKKQTELEAKVESLNAQTVAVQSASDKQYQITRTRLLKEIADYAEQVEAERKAEREKLVALQRLEARYGEVFGTEGTATSAMESFRLKGIEVAESLQEVFFGEDGKSGLIKGFQELAAVIGNVASGFAQMIVDITGNLKNLGYVVLAAGAMTGNVGLLATGAAMVAAGTAATGNPLPDPAQSDALYYGTIVPAYKALEKRLDTKPTYDQVAALVDGLGLKIDVRARSAYIDRLLRGNFVAKALGGLAGARGPELSLLGEGGGPEWVINNRALRALTSLNRAPAQALAAVAAGGGSSGGSPVIIRLEIGGKPLIDYVDQGLAYRRRA